MKITTKTILLLFSGLLCFPAVSSAVEQAMRFGVVPYLSPSRMDDIYSPVSRGLSDSLNRPVKFRTSSTLPRFKNNLADADYDFALVVPMLYPYAVDQLGYMPLLRMQERIYSVIAVAEDSPVKSIHDLAGKAIETPAFNGPVSRLAQKHLAENGISADTNTTFAASKTVGACLKKLIVHQVDACIVPSFAVATFEQTTGVKLRTLFRSEGIPSRVLVVHPRVPEAVSSNIRQTLLSWGDSEKGRVLLKSMKTKGFVDVIDSDYDIIRDVIKTQGN